MKVFIITRTIMYVLHSTAKHHTHLFIDVIVALKVSRSSWYHMYMHMFNCLTSITTILQWNGYRHETSNRSYTHQTIAAAAALNLNCYRQTSSIEQFLNHW